MSLNSSPLNFCFTPIFTKFYSYLNLSSKVARLSYLTVAVERTERATLPWRWKEQNRMPTAAHQLAGKAAYWELKNLS